MERDLRGTPLYREIEQHFLKTLEPAFGRISGAADVQASPDGLRVAFTGSLRDRLEGVPTTRICVVDVGSGSLETVTAGPNDDRLPRWSPDGSRLAFLSDRAEKGKHQLYLLEAGRIGEAVVAPKVEGTVEYLGWSPDGRSILIGVAGAGSELAGVQGSGSAERGLDVGPSWMPEVRVPAGEDEWRRAWVVDVGAGSPRPASREGLNVWESAWCGTDRIVAVVSDGPGEADWYAAPVAIIDLASGKERIVYRSARQLGLLAASPGGRRLAVVQALCSDRMVVAGDLVLVDPETGEASVADTANVDVTGLAWANDDRLLFAGLRGVDAVVGELDAPTGRVTELFATGESLGGLLYPDACPLPSGGFATVVHGSRRHPEVAVVEDGTLRTVTSLAHPGAQYQAGLFGARESVTWTAPDGLEIQGFLVRPAGNGPHPLIMWVHGGPVGAETDTWPGPLLPLLVGRGYALLIPNPRGSSGRGQAFAEMVDGDMGGADAVDDLTGVDAMVERGIADPERLVVMGGSYGGFMSCWLPTMTDRFAAAVAISPVTDWYSQHWTSNIASWDSDFLGEPPATPAGAYFHRSPVMQAAKVKTPTLLTAGLRDRCTPPGQAVEFFQALAENGVETALALYPEEGHGVRSYPTVIDFATRIVDWLERHAPAHRGGQAP